MFFSLLLTSFIFMSEITFGKVSVNSPNDVIDTITLHSNAQQETHWRYGRPCPCENKTLCQPVRNGPRQEVFIFSVEDTYWRSYDWTKVTTVVLFGGINDQLLCYAHSKGVRVTTGANIPTSQLTNSTYRADWITKRVQFIRENFLDGVNVDYESQIDKNQTAVRDGLTKLIMGLTMAVKDMDSNLQVTVDFAWSPDGIDSRWYDYPTIAEVVDFTFIMAYDERSQIRGDCIAWANSAFNNTKHGLERFLSLGVEPKKMVLGVPWYGYKYTCHSYDTTSHRCEIKPVPFRGVPCSDAAGRQIGYGKIMNELLPASFTGRLWDDASLSPYFVYKDSVTGDTYEVWYDDPQSLTAKYRLAGHLQLRGVGMWNADLLDYSKRGQITDMWGILPG